MHADSIRESIDNPTMLMLPHITRPQRKRKFTRSLWSYAANNLIPEPFF